MTGLLKPFEGVGRAKLAALVAVDLEDDEGVVVL